MLINKDVQQSSVHESFITQKLTSILQCHGEPNTQGKDHLLEYVFLLGTPLHRMPNMYTLMMSE